MSKKLTNNIYQFEDNETGWGSQMNQNLKALDDTIGELKNVYKKSEVDTELSNKQDKLTSTQNNAINSGIDSTKVSGYDAHVSDTDIHVTVSDKANWNAKPNKSTTLSGYGITDAYTKTEIDNSIKDFATKSTTLSGYGITDAYTKKEVDTKLTSVYRYKGSVAQYLDLPTQNNVVGDVWNVSSNGMNYAWDGATWDNLGATVDLSNYVKNTDYATISKGGVIKPSSDSATDVVNGVLQATTKTTTQYNSADNSMFVSKGTLDNVLTSKDYATNTNLSSKANVSDVYTQAEVNNLVSKKADATSVYTKTQIDSSLSGKQDKLSATQLSNIADVSNKANASDVYNKTDIDDKLDLKQDSLTQAQLNACNSGITATKVTNLETHTSNSNIHVTANDKNTWNAKQDALTSDQIANINSISQLDSKYVKSDDTTFVRLNNLNEINLQEDHYNAWFGYRGGEVTNWKFGNGSEGGLADVYANDFYLNDESLSEKLEAKANDSNVVHKNGDEAINGLKSFYDVGRYYIDVETKNSNFLNFKALNIDVDSETNLPTKNYTFSQNITSSKPALYLGNYYSITAQGITGTDIRNYKYNSSKEYAGISIRYALNDETNISVKCNSFEPIANNVTNLGSYGNKWKDVYATTFNGNVVGEGALSLQSKSGTSRIYLRDNVASSYPSSVNLYSKIGDNPEYGVFLNGQNFHPNSSNVMNLGTNNHKWANVFTTLINDKDPAYDDSVVHNSGDETIGGQKIFNSNVVGVGRDVHHFSSTPYGKNTPPTSNVAQYVMFIGNKASDGFANSWYSGYLENRVDSNGTARGRWLIRNTDEQTVGLELLSSIDGARTVRPMINNEIMLGLTSHKWADVNTTLLNGKTPDLIEDQGTNYIRYSSGLQICWATIELNDLKRNQGYSNEHYFPKPFASVPSVTANYSSAYSTDTVIASEGIDNTHCTFWIKNTVLDVSNFKINYIAIGMWK